MNLEQSVSRQLLIVYIELTSLFTQYNLPRAESFIFVSCLRLTVCPSWVIQN